MGEVFTEVIAAPDFDADALALLTTKKNLRLLRCAAPVRGGAETRPISGGLLMQIRDTIDAVVERRPAGRRRAVALAAGVRAAG